MYNSLVLPHFTYCSNVWNDGNRTHIEKLYKMQKRATRVITGSNYSEMFERLGWEPIEDTLKKRDILTLSKGLKDDLLENITKKLSLNMISNINYDNNCKLNLQKSDFMKKSFSYRGASTWNSMPNEVVNNYANLSTAIFKISIANYFNNSESNS